MSEYEQLNIDRSLTPVAAAIYFELTVQPCIVTDFDIIAAPDAQISYTLGEEGFTFGHYEFEMRPDCGYGMQVTFENLPAEPFITHNADDGSFTVSKTNDPKFLGVHEVEIIGEYTQLNIDKSTTAVTQTISFTLTVQPCMVQSLEIVQAPEPEIHYTLDTPSFSFGPYEFA